MKKIRGMGKAMEMARNYGSSFVDEYIAMTMNEWEDLDYPAFMQALADTNAPAFYSSFDRAECIGHLKQRARRLFSEYEDGKLYDAAANAAWDRLQELLEA